MCNLKYNRESGEKMKKFAVGLLVSSLIFLGGCSKSEKTDKSEPLVTVNGRIITEKMFQETLEQNFNAPEQKENAKDPKSKFIYLVHKNRVINDLIIKQLIDEEAEKRQIKIEDAEIDAIVDSIVKSMGGEDRFKASLALNKIDEKVFRENIKVDLLKRKLIENVIGDSKVSDDEIAKFYEENKENKFKHDSTVRASHILISASGAEMRNLVVAKDKENKLTEDEINKQVKKEMAKAKAKAQKIYKEAKKNPDKFVELAKQNSEDPSSAAKGGDLGFFSKEEMVPEFSEAAFSTKPGELSDVVKTEFGYHIIKVVDRKQEGITPLDEIKPHIERYLDGKKKMDAFKKLIETSKQSAKIVYLNEDYDPEEIKAEYHELIKELKKEPTTEPRSSKKPEESTKTSD